MVLLVIILLLLCLKIIVIFCARLKCDLIVLRLFFIWPKLSAGTLEQRKCRVRVSPFVRKNVGMFML